MLQQARRGRNAVIGRLAHEQEHIDALGLDIVVGKQLLGGLETQVARGHIGSCNAALLDTDVVDCFLDFLLGDKISQVLVINYFLRDTSRQGLNAHAMIGDSCHK